MSVFAERLTQGSVSADDVDAAIDAAKGERAMQPDTTPIGAAAEREAWNGGEERVRALCLEIYGARSN